MGVYRPLVKLANLCSKLQFPDPIDMISYPRTLCPPPQPSPRNVQLVGESPGDTCIEGQNGTIQLDISKYPITPSTGMQRQQHTSTCKFWRMRID